MTISRLHRPYPPSGVLKNDPAVCHRPDKLAGIIGRWEVVSLASENGCLHSPKPLWRDGCHRTYAARFRSGFPDRHLESFHWPGLSNRSGLVKHDSCHIAQNKYVGNRAKKTSSADIRQGIGERTGSADDGTDDNWREHSCHVGEEIENSAGYAHELLGSDIGNYGPAKPRHSLTEESERKNGDSYVVAVHIIRGDDG